MFPQMPVSYPTDGDTFLAPSFGGTEAVKWYNLTYAIANTATLAGTLPAGATIVGVSLVVDTTFDGTPTLTVATTTTGTDLLNAASVLGTAGPVYSTAWATSGKWFSKLGSDTPIYVLVSATSPTQGSAWLAVRYVMK
jgi:hypothetical protein